MKKVWTLKVVYQAIIEYVKGIKSPKWQFIVYIAKRPLKRTIPQNSLFHVIFEIIRDEEENLWNQYTFEEIKKIMKMSLIWIKTVKLKWFVMHEPLKWTSQLTEAEWIDFITKMIEWCNKQYWIKFISKDDERFLDYYNNYYWTWEKHF